MKTTHSIVLLAAALCLLCAGPAQAGNLFSYDFEGLTAGQTIVGQDNWVSMNNSNRKDAWVGVGTGVNTSNVFMSVDENGTTVGAKISDARRPFDTPLTFTTDDTNVEFSFLSYNDRGEYTWDYSNNCVNMWYDGIANDLNGGMGMYYLSSSQTQPRTYFRSYTAVATYGDSLISGNWYEMKYMMDFSDGAGKITLQYRNITAEEETFTTDSVIQGISMDLTMNGGEITFDSLHGFVQAYNNYTQHSFIDDISITKVPEPSTLALLGCGLFGLLAYAWRKRK
ncbi:MAG: PEP-CTERM sorting domain-containing protein [Pirellulaceae bacterium]|nr:PEP-CTERM sorting domain-containing protein [Pirellulaceae bacterium]